MSYSLSAENLLGCLRDSFKKVSDGRQDPEITLPDALMSGTAVYGMKYASLLQFDHDVHQRSVVGTNLQNLYGVETVPSDTQMRTILDPVDPRQLHRGFRNLFAKFQASGKLDDYRYLDDSYLMSIDGTRFFASDKVHCENCCETHHSSGSTTFHHDALPAVIVHPEKKQVIPIGFEPIVKQDGSTKNDCERNASKRLLEDIRREHPHLKIILLIDGLGANEPQVRLARDLSMHFIINVKPGDHEALFNLLEDAADLGGVGHHKIIDGDTWHDFRYINDVPLNGSEDSVHVNLLDYIETTKTGTTHFTFITDFELTTDLVYKIMRGGRSRWRIENETFNTLKNQGYKFEHNFGHGYQNLANVMAMLMMFAFLIDQLQELASPIFQTFLARSGRHRYAWELLRAFFLLIVATTWTMLYLCIINNDIAVVLHDTS